jgi:hypothetical protein
MTILSSSSFWFFIGVRQSVNFIRTRTKTIHKDSHTLAEKMGLVVLPALVPDIPKVYDTYFAAFKGELILDVLFPGGITDDFRECHSAVTLSYWHKSELQHTLKCVDTDTGEIVGMALWDVYLQERSEEERKEPAIVWLEGQERERAEKLLSPLWETKEKLWGGRKHVCKRRRISPLPLIPYLDQGPVNLRGLHS